LLIDLSDDEAKEVPVMENSLVEIASVASSQTDLSYRSVPSRSSSSGAVAEVNTEVSYLALLESEVGPVVTPQVQVSGPCAHHGRRTQVRMALGGRVKRRLTTPVCDEGLSSGEGDSNSGSDGVAGSFGQPACGGTFQ